LSRAEEERAEEEGGTPKPKPKDTQAISVKLKKGEN